MENPDIENIYNIRILINKSTRCFWTECNEYGALPIALEKRPIV